MFDKKEIIINGYRCVLKLVIEEDLKLFTKNNLPIKKFYVMIEIWDEFKVIKRFKSFCTGTENASNQIVFQMTETIIKEAKKETENINKNVSIKKIWNELDLETLF